MVMINKETEEPQKKEIQEPLVKLTKKEIIEMLQQIEGIKRKLKAKLQTV